MKDTVLILGMLTILSAAGLAQAQAKAQAQAQAQAQQTTLWDSDDLALIVADYQPETMAGLTTISAKKVELNVRFLIRMAKIYEMPIVLTSVGVDMGYNKPTVEALQNELPGVDAIDRSSMNAWDDPEFRAAVRATGKKRFVFVGLWTDICVVFPTIDMLAEGYEVMFIADAIGATEQLPHDMAIERMIHAGAVPATISTITTEMFRDWLSPKSKKVGDTLNWYLAEKQKKRYVDVFNGPNN